MRFAKEYVENVLQQNFDDFREFFLDHLIDIHYAHLIMLHRTGILAQETARALAQALDSLQPEGWDKVPFDGSFEDAFFFVEGQLVQAAGADVAGRLHTARSRNDIDATLYRLRWRQDFVALQAAALELRSTLIELSSRELETLLPLHTHTQPAQPSTIGHYMHGVVEHLERDHERLDHALRTLNRNPLGSCAITGTSFPIDRELTSRLLAFDGSAGNTYAGIAAADYLLEGIAAAMILLSMLGRFVQDLLQWSTREFRFLRLGDGYVQTSSIMPQKRNPVSLEHSRALASRALGQAQAVFQVLHNTPFGDIVDVEDDLQPLVFRALQDTVRPLRLVAGALATATFDRPYLEERARQDWITVTDLADTLVGQNSLSFRVAHEIAGSVIREFEGGGSNSLSEALAKVSLGLAGVGIRMTDAELSELLEPRNFVERRRTTGGPSAAVLGEAVAASRTRLNEDRRQIECFVEKLNSYRPALREHARRI